MWRAARALATLLVAGGIGSIAAGIDQLASPATVAGAANGYGPGVGPQTPTGHWGGAYVLQGVPGYGYCIQPGAADPIELSATTWSPVPYPGSRLWSNGQMAALAYFAERYQGTGYGGYSVSQTTAAIADVAYASAGGTTPPSSRPPAQLLADVEAWIVTYAGPWTIAVSMTPPAGATFAPSTNYSGTITVRSATGAGVGGLELIPPATGGPSTGEISNFVWLQPTTDAAGAMGFQWNIDSSPPGGSFAAGGIGIIGGAPGTAPPTYGTPTGVGGQTMLVSGAPAGPTTSFSGVVAASATDHGTISIDKAVADASFYQPVGAVFQVRNGAGQVLDTLTTNIDGQAGPSIPLTAPLSGALYDVHEAVAPLGYLPAPDQVVRVYPNQDTVVTYSGANEEPSVNGQLEARKVDAQTGQPLAGAVFDFHFDRTNRGTYPEDLGQCTTGANGACQPPQQTAPGGWLPGWYRVTEVRPPSGYSRTGTSATQYVFVRPNTTAVATVTFADLALGSLQLRKSGNDTAYWPVAGAAFSVAGPAPSASVVGTLVVGSTGASNVLTSLVPGTYTVTETRAPPGYGTVAPFTTYVAPGHATTVVSAVDAVQPGTLVIRKTDRLTGVPLAGATFETAYDSHDDGTFDVDLGTCTTGAAGTCAPPPNDGTGFLPGRYRVTEVAAPAGYALPTPAPSQTIVVDPAASATFSFTDQELVGASFLKVATGSVNPTLLVLAGAVVDVTAGPTYGGTVVASCTTAADGKCTTGETLLAGDPYCWREVTAPPGLAAGATGCFTASDAQATEPIVVSDPGRFVPIAAKKVDRADPSVTLPGAVFDLYRVDGGHGPSAPTPPADARLEAGQTWVARSTSGPTGVATFPLELPGYAYCVVEHAAPPDYVTVPTEHCTGVLTGPQGTPPVAVTVTVPDTPVEVSVTARKFNTATPGTGIPDAVYDLYVEGAGPPGGPSTTAPSGAATIPGAKWWARGTTAATGSLGFQVPAGYAWCLHEVSAPVDYTLDPALHCTATVTASGTAGHVRVALPETTALVEVYAHKFNALAPDTSIPGATYEMVGQGPVPAGWSASPDPFHYLVPAGDWYVGTTTTDAQGLASWTVPAGHSWCLHEIHAPAGYALDTGWHCTGLVTTLTPAPKATVALPEVAIRTVIATATASSSATLAFTGGPGTLPVAAGSGSAVAGISLIVVTRRRRTRPGGRLR